MLVTTNIVGNNSRVFPFLCPLCCTFFCWEGLSQRVGTVTRRWWYTSSTHHLVFLHKISIKSSLSCNFGYRWLDHYPFTGMCYILFFHLRSRSIDRYLTSFAHTGKLWNIVSCRIDPSPTTNLGHPSTGKYEY